jgi:hypothetical protein
VDGSSGLKWSRVEWRGVEGSGSSESSLFLKIKVNYVKK